MVMGLAPSFRFISRGDKVCIFCCFAWDIVKRQFVRRLLLLLVNVTVGDGDRSFDWIVLKAGFAFDESRCCWLFLMLQGCWSCLWSGLGRLTCILLFSRSLFFFRLLACWAGFGLSLLSDTALISNLRI